MKAPVILLLILSLSFCVHPVKGQPEEGDLNVVIDFTPETNYSQMVFGENYTFDVRIENQALDLSVGDIVHPVLKAKFSGDIVIHTSFTVNQEGGLPVGTETVDYIIPLLAWEESNDIALPDVGESASIQYKHKCTTGYGSGVNIDEWVTFNIDVQVYLWEYIEIRDEPDRYLLSESTIGEAHLKFYVVNGDKMNYVASVLTAMGEDLLEAREAIRVAERDLDMDVGVSLTEYEAAFEAMSDHISAGDYVSAMTVYDEHQPTWKDRLISSLKVKVKELQPLEGILANYSAQFEELTLDLQTLQTEYENLTTTQQQEVDDLNTQLSDMKSRSRLYLFGMVILGAVLVAAFIRMTRDKKT
ncbi:MAG: hypothetical protein PVJ38_05620 [Candidatus Bathyarchaeota archaeon]|jgi:hypothetical protein